MDASRFRAIVAGTVLAGAAVGAATMALSPHTTPAPLAAMARPPFAEGRLWRVSHPEADDSFVFGTIHVADPRVAGLAAPVEEALARSRHVLLERDPRERIDAEAYAKEALDDGGRLAPLVGAEAFARVHDALLGRGVPEETIGRLKPWAALLKLARTPPRDDGLTLDEAVFLAARTHGLPVHGLESIDDQIAAFDRVPLDSQVALLRHAIARGEASAAAVEPVVAAWLRGDIVALASGNAGAIARAPELQHHYDVLRERVVDERTLTMFHRLYIPMRSGGVFVAVGAAHLAGDGGLLAQLQREGYYVRREW